MPLVLIAALCRDDMNPFGDADKCSTDGVAYISFGQWVGVSAFWLDSFDPVHLSKVGYHFVLNL